jgi:predicted MFS family arabinose efflux permease
MVQAGDGNRGLAALLAGQALSAFNHNLLRSALLTLVSFRGLTALGLAPEATIAVSTLVIVVPYVLLSLPAGRIADRFARGTVIRIMLGLDIVVLALGAIGLGMGDGALLLLALLLAGMQAAMLGPAKYAILPELSRPGGLIASNGLMSASTTLSILVGMILGNLLVLHDTGLAVIMAGSVLLAVLGWGFSLAVGGGPAKAPALPVGPATLLSDYRDLWARCRRTPLVAWPLVGSCWFWFQGTLFTALMPHYVAQTGQPAHHVSYLLLASSIGVALGALAASRLVSRFAPGLLALVLVPFIALPGLDFWMMSRAPGGPSIARAMIDLMLIAAGSGFYLVPMTAAIQRLTPMAERARFIGISHTLSGSAMCMAGVVILVYPALGLSVVDAYLLVSLPTGFIAALALIRTLRPFGASLASDAAG